MRHKGLLHQFTEDCMYKGCAMQYRRRARNCEARTPFGNDRMPVKISTSNSVMRTAVCRRMSLRCAIPRQHRQIPTWPCAAPETGDACGYDSNCPSGDHRRPNVAPYSDFNNKDGRALRNAKNTCRYTPRVMLISITGAGVQAMWRRCKRIKPSISRRI